MENVVTQADIVLGIKRLNIPENPVLFVHSSLSSFGKVEGGADAVICALADVCGARGTLVMPTLTFGAVSEENAIFDVNYTPSVTGVVTEAFRKTEGVRRSHHVLSSVCAKGFEAEFITNWHDDTPCGTNTPYDKIIRLNGYSLFLGAGFGSNSLFHCAEEAVKPSYLCYKTIENAKIIDESGNESIYNFRRYDCSQRGIARKLGRMESVFRERGVIQDTMIGNCHAMLISAQDNFKISCEILRQNPAFITE